VKWDWLYFSCRRVLTSFSTKWIVGSLHLFLYPLKLALASLTGGDRSIGIVRLRTKNHGVFLYIQFSHVILLLNIVLVSQFMIYSLHTSLDSPTTTFGSLWTQQWSQQRRTASPVPSCFKWRMSREGIVAGSVIIRGYPCYELHTTFCRIFSQG
jgi:hypothetical protein